MTTGTAIGQHAPGEIRPIDPNPPAGGVPRWGRGDVVPLLLVVLVFVSGYVVRMTDAPLQGEETRRAIFSRTMLQTGEWMVPKEQGIPLIDRPPAFYWINAGVFHVLGRQDVFAMRFATVATTLLTALMVYAYARRFVAPAAACVGGTAYLTMAMVLDMGRRAETEGVFTFLFAASLMAWHWCYASGRRPVVTWAAGYVLCAVAALVKGTQAPVCFGGAVVLYLLLRRDWRFLFGWSHLIGIALFVAVVGAWQVPFYMMEGWDGFNLSWFGPTTQRLHASVGKFVAHLVTFPVEAMIVMLPWSLFLPALLSRGFREQLGTAGPAAVFLGVAVFVTFVPVWIVPDARGRYFMPGFPLVAGLVAVVAHRCLAAAAAGEHGPPQFWRGTTRTVAVAFAAAIAFVVIAAIAERFVSADWLRRAGQPAAFVALYAALGTACVVAVFRATTRLTARHVLITSTALATLVVLTWNGAIVNVMLRNGVDVAGEVRAIEARLPPGTRLVSLGVVQHKFAFCIDYPIRRIDWPRTADEMDPSVTYFCFTQRRGKPVTVPFAWEPLASVNVDRSAKPDPNIRVVVGRRLPDAGWQGPTTGPTTWRAVGGATDAPGPTADDE